MCPIICTMPLSISIHALLAESDAYQSGLLLGICHFYPRSPCGERPIGPQIIADRVAISIHALLAESDLTIMLYDSSALIFLSTLSLRRATVTSSTVIVILSNFYPRSPCGERPIAGRITSNGTKISIHALLAESDAVLYRILRMSLTFLSTLSLRRATLGAWKSCNVCGISIHALLAESDDAGDRATAQTAYFYPRSPCGERPWARGSRVTYVEFLSTLSLRRATVNTF